MKNLKYFGTVLLFSFIFTINVFAASGSINVSSSSKTVAVGSTFSVTVKVSCSEALGSWQYGLAYDSSYISLQSGDTTVASYGDGSTKTKSYTYKFKAIKAGNAGIRISGASMVSWNDVDTLFTPSTSSASVVVKTKEEIAASYSKDNNLKALSIEGYELSPAFDKNTTEYSVTVPETVESIIIHAQVNDGTASVSGAGNIQISSGTNKINVIVTAQNGSTKTYTINVDVKDINPIEVNLDNKTYTVVKKAELLPEVSAYTATTIYINDIEVPAYKNDNTGFVLVGLKDEEGNISLYSYNQEENEYEKYDEIKGASLILYPMLGENLPGFKQEKITINEKEYTAFINEKDKEFILIYAMNVETGDKDYYIYDKVSNSFVKYNSKMFDTYEKELKEQKFLIIVSITGCALLLLLTILLGRKNKKIKKLLIKYADKHGIKSEEIIESDEINEEIEEDSVCDSEVVKETEMIEKLEFNEEKEDIDNKDETVLEITQELEVDNDDNEKEIKSEEKTKKNSKKRKTKKED